MIQAGSLTHILTSNRVPDTRGCLWAVHCGLIILQGLVVTMGGPKPPCPCYETFASAQACAVITNWAPRNGRYSPLVRRDNREWLISCRDGTSEAGS